MLPSVETNDGRGSSRKNAIDENECRALDENVSPTSKPGFTLYPRGIRSEGPQTNNELQGVPSQRRRYIGALVGFALLLSILITLDYYLRKVGSGGPDEKAKSSEKQSGPTSNSSMSSMVAPHKLGVPSDAGFILQVAVMKEEKDAISFADLLRQKGFPAYVFKPASAKLYRVLVGPYSDADSAVKVEEELRKEGFDAIRRKNTLAQ